jgi:hypothetical protein
MLVPPVLAISFNRPEAFIVLLAAVPIIVAYLIDPIRRRSDDPFFFLWTTLARPRPWIGRLSRVLELVLLLLALALLATALADPGVEVEKPPRRAVIVAAVAPGRDPSVPHLSAALAEIRAVLQAIGPHESGCVLVANPEGTRTLVPPTPGPIDLKVLHGGLFLGPPDRAVLVRRAGQLASRLPGAEVHWFDFEPPPGLPDSWKVHPVRGPGDEARVALSVDRLKDGTLQATALNLGPHLWKGQLRTRVGDAAATVVEVEVPPHDRLLVPVSLARNASGLVHLALVPRGAQDPAATAGHVIPAPRRPRIGVLARPDSGPVWTTLIEKFAHRINPDRSAVLDAEKGGDYLGQFTRDTLPFDILIFEEPPKVLPDLGVPMLMFGGAGPLGEVTGQPTDGGGIASWQRDHPVFTGVDFSPLALDETLPVKAGEGVQVLATGPAGPIALFRAGPPPMLAFAFAFEKSNLVWQWTFTTLISNLVRLWGGEQPEVGPFRVGEPIPLPPGNDVIAVSREGVASTLWVGRAGDGFAFRARQPGQFKAEGESGRRDCFFNPVLPPADGQSEPMPALDRAEGSAGASGASPPGWLSRLSVVVWIALAVLLVEWVVYHRGML